jgi:propionate CoA-transferase
MAKFVTAREAAKLIPDGATVGLAGMGLSGWPEEIAVAIAENYKETGHPRGLTLKQGSAMGDWKERGVTRLGIEGLVTRW